MTIWDLILILSFILAAGSGFLYLVLKGSANTKKKSNTLDSFQAGAEQDVEHIFNAEFREELRNRGRLHFEKILGENAMFLQQDLRLTTSQLNDYMKEEISKDLKNSFDNYQNAISDAKQLAIESIQKTKEVIDTQRQELAGKMEAEVQDEKQRRVESFEMNMTQIVNHYIQQAIGDQIDLQDQLEYILGELETNKQAIMEDIRNGA
jgi:hypothetical protein